jgi:hypothetical protein
MFLSKAERDYLLDRDRASHDYVCVKSRLNKKMKVFVDQELSLLLSKGYLMGIAEFRNIAENCKVQEDGLVRIPQTGDKRSYNNSILAKIITKGSGPGEIRTPDPRHVKAVS